MPRSPSLWVRLWHRIQAVLKVVGRIQSAVLLSVFYALFWVPVGLVSRLCVDWLHWRAPNHSNWYARPDRINDPRHTRDPF